MTNNYTLMTRIKKQIINYLEKIDLKIFFYIVVIYCNGSR